MKQLVPSKLKLGVKTHNELVHTKCLIMVTMMSIGLRIGKELSSMDNVVRRCESINLMLEPTILIVELINSVLPLLETTEGLV